MHVYIIVTKNIIFLFLFIFMSFSHAAVFQSFGATTTKNQNHAIPILLLIMYQRYNFRCKMIQPWWVRAWQWTFRTGIQSNQLWAGTHSTAAPEARGQTRLDSACRTHHHYQCGIVHMHVKSHLERSMYILWKAASADEVFVVVSSIGLNNTWVWRPKPYKNKDSGSFVTSFPHAGLK